MKTLKTLLAFVTMAIAFVSCETDAVKPVLKATVAANELQAPSSSAYVLTVDNKANTFETFHWTATDFGFTASVSYQLQVDIVSDNFATPITIATTNSLQAAITVGPFNDQLLGLGLNPDEATDLQIRVVSTVNDKVAAVYSNVKTITVTAYATSFPPIYGMGDALKGWGPWGSVSIPGNEVEWQSTEYKKYETVTYINNGGAFRWFAQLDWNPTSYNVPFFTSIPSDFVSDGGSDSNFKFLGTSGWYKVNVDLKNKTVTMLSVSEPVMYMTGPGVGGWDQPGTGQSVKMNYLKPGVFSVLTNFNNGGAFRFFPQADWSPSYNYPYFTTVAADFENASDGDSNLKYVGVTGAKKITVDINAKTVIVGDAPIPVLYMTGDATGGWDQPGTGASVKMTYKSPGIFEATTTFTNGGAFRFFPQENWSPSYNYPYFTTVDANFVNAGDGDLNLKFVGTTGSHKISVNLTTKVVTFTP